MGRIELRSSHLCEDCLVGVSNTVEQCSFPGGLGFSRFVNTWSHLKCQSLPVHLI